MNFEDAPSVAEWPKLPIHPDHYAQITAMADTFGFSMREMLFEVLDGVLIAEDGGYYER